MSDVHSVDHSDLEKYIELENMNIPLDRKSKDKKTNAHGIRFIVICRNNDLFILNGRLYNDTKGNFTFKQKSVIDYVIATAACFKHVRGFNIVETDTLLTDGHSILQFELGSLRLLKTETPSTQHPNLSRWQDNKILDFVNNLDRSHIQSIMDQLNTYPQFQSTIENLSNNIAPLFSNTSRATFTSRTRASRPPLKNNKPWFGSKCHRARKKYNRAKQIYNLLPTDFNKRMLNTASKQYKHIINYHIQNYKFDKAKKLRSMSTKRQYYWKFLNGLKAKSRENNSPSLHDFYDYYKNINSNDTDTMQVTDLPNVYYTNQVLNYPIRPPEVEKSIISLNNGKACSPVDNIVNEYLKYSKDLLLPLLTKLFNCIFDTGFIPESWVKGVIIPVFKNKGDPNQAQKYRPITILSCLGKLL